MFWVAVFSIMTRPFVTLIGGNNEIKGVVDEVASIRVTGRL